MKVEEQVEEFFNQLPTVNQKAFGIINDFYHLVLTENDKLKTDGLLSPQNTILDLAKVADKEGFEIIIKVR